MRRSHGHIIGECKASCLVPSPVERMCLILVVFPPTRQHKLSMLSMQRRTEKRIELILLIPGLSIHLWITVCQPRPPPFPSSLTLILATLHLVKPCQLYHHFLNPIPVLLPPLVQGPHHLLLSLHQSVRVSKLHPMLP
jgi:hypothetical protein